MNFMMREFATSVFSCHSMFLVPTTYPNVVVRLDGQSVPLSTDAKGKDRGWGDS
jgi:hypothetical protein